MKFEELTALLVCCLEERGITEDDIKHFQNITQVRKFLQALNQRKWRDKHPTYYKDYNESHYEDIQRNIKKHQKKRKDLRSTN